MVKKYFNYVIQKWIANDAINDMQWQEFQWFRSDFHSKNSNPKTSIEWNEKLF